jgi:hypothetical protein
MVVAIAFVVLGSAPLAFLSNNTFSHYAIYPLAAL